MSIFDFNTLQSLLILYLHIMKSKIYSLGSSAVGTIEVLDAPSISIRQRAINIILRPYINSLYHRYTGKFMALAKRINKRPTTGNAITDLRMNEFELRWLMRGFLRFRWRRWAISRFCVDLERNSDLADTILSLQDWNNWKWVNEGIRLLDKQIDNLRRSA